MKEIRVATCGCGKRGSGLTKDVLCKLDGIKIVAVSDPYEDKAQSLADTVKEEKGYSPVVYTDHNKLLDEVKPDAVLVSASWESHAQVAIDAMNKGIAVAMEVGGAYNEKECWDLVDTYEKTKTPIMLMENCCFDDSELLATNLTRKGILGDIVYCNGAYAHDLREEVSYGDIKRHYRLRNYMHRNCENYPTHELGPIAKLLNINRGNRMTSLVSRSSKSLGLHTYINNKGDSQLDYLKDVEFKQGDIVETLIYCENGEMIRLKLDTTLPRFYSREFTVRGTKGFYNLDNDMVLEDGKIDVDFPTYEAYKTYNHNSVNYAEYRAKIWKDVTPEIMEAGHGGMDYFEFVAFFDALRKGEEMPIDVYDAAAWMSITYLTELSIKNNGAPVEIPDFTRGKYKNRPSKDVTEF